MFNIADKEDLVTEAINFIVGDVALPDRLIQNLAFTWINIVSLDGSNNPITPTAGFYEIYVRTNKDTGFENVDIGQHAIFTGGSSLADGVEKASFYGAIFEEIKIVPVGIVGAVSYKVYIRQSDSGARAEIAQDLIFKDTFGERFIDTRNTAREETAMSDGSYFTGSTQRSGVATNNVFHSVITSGDKYLVIEDVIITTNFSLVTDGNVNLQLNAYVEASNGNTWSFTTDGIITPMGRPVNAELINQFPLSIINRGVTGVSLVGDEDYNIFYVDYFIDTQGNRNIKSTDRAQFFEGTRKLLIPPNSTVLVKTESTGTATGTLDISTVFFISEFDKIQT